MQARQRFVIRRPQPHGSMGRRLETRRIHGHAPHALFIPNRIAAGAQQIGGFLTHRKVEGRHVRDFRQQGGQVRGGSVCEQHGRIETAIDQQQRRPAIRGDVPPGGRAIFRREVRQRVDGPAAIRLQNPADGRRISGSRHPRIQSSRGGENRSTASESSSASTMCGASDGMTTASPARRIRSSPEIAKRSAPLSTMLICSLGWLCMGTTAPLRNRMRATVTFCPCIILRPNSGLSGSSSSRFQS